MSEQVLADELEKEILLFQKELIVKRALLQESREKLQSEIKEHMKSKLIATTHQNENKELKMQLEFSLTATFKLEEEINKNREQLVKLQVQRDTYLTENRQLLERCYNLEVENNQLRSDVTDLNEQLKGHLAFQENYKKRQLETENLINNVLRKQETLNKDQAQLEAACKEGLLFANRVAEEADFQAKYVEEANKVRIKMEEEMIRLIATIKELKKKENVVTNVQQETPNYLDEWKSYQEEMDVRVRELIAENKRLTEELNFATAQIEILMKNY